MAQSGASPRRASPSSPAPTTARCPRSSAAEIEEALKAGRLPAVVATSSLELGIDMGAVDLVIQVESPPSVASGLQRVGRAGHQVGAVSRGVIFPKYRGDLVQTAVVAERMRDGADRGDALPAQPARRARPAGRRDGRARRVGRSRRCTTSCAAPRPTPRCRGRAFESVLDMLAGRYPSDEFAELRPRLVWDRVAGTLTGRPGAQRLAVTSGGTIPDRGLFGVFLVGRGRAGRRVGELDEEMVYESRVGDVFTLGSTSWRIEDITHDQVLVTPAPGQPGRLPFWKGDALGRPVELGRALGAFVRELGGARRRPRPASGCSPPGSTRWAADNLLAYLDEQREATGHLPDDRTIVVERFRDELGDWRVAIHSPFGAQVHAPWALAVAARLRERYGVDVQAMHADDGIVLRLPDIEFDATTTGSAARTGTEIAVFEPDEVEALVTAEVGGSALFASRFRECAARALLLPRRNPGRRSAAVAAAAALGAAAVGRQRLRLVPGRARDDARVPAGRVRRARAGRADARRRGAHGCASSRSRPPQPSPFARSLLFGYVAQFLYEGDSPLAERRAAALALDPTLLAELLGQRLRRAARAARPRRGRLPRARPAAAVRRPPGAATPRASPTCCACSAR